MGASPSIAGQLSRRRSPARIGWVKAGSPWKRWRRSASCRCQRSVRPASSLLVLVVRREAHAQVSEPDEVLLRDSPFPLSAVIPELWQAARAERADRQRCLRALVQRLAIGRPWLVGQPVLDASARAVAAGDAEFGSRAMALRQTASSGRGTRRLTRRGGRELPPHLE